jgi:hypothetical protein
MLLTFPDEWDDLTCTPMLRFAFQMAYPTVIVGGLIKDALGTKEWLRRFVATEADVPLSLEISMAFGNRFPALSTLIQNLRLTDIGARIPTWLRTFATTVTELLFSIDDPSLADHWNETSHQGTVVIGALQRGAVHLW